MPKVFLNCTAVRKQVYATCPSSLPPTPQKEKKTPNIATFECNDEEVWDGFVSIIHLSQGALGHLFHI